MSIPGTYSYLLTTWRWCLLTAAFVTLPPAPGTAMASGNELEFTVKSAYIYNFIQFIDWPESPNSPAPEPVTICMIGGGHFGSALAELSRRQVKGHHIQVEQRTPDTADLASCHVVVIDRSEENHLSPILTQLTGANVLTVSDIPQFAQKGGGIGFVINEGKVKIEINSRTTQQAGLKVSAKLLEVARIVQ